ncbi:hypothetical protein F4818DRAFT_94744 [Hypoxylon cercidicola]|nr:hypothetical protein F4818DRAFT_94744 [Hypoxylon cercidicola]
MGSVVLWFCPSSGTRPLPCLTLPRRFHSTHEIHSTSRHSLYQRHFPEHRVSWSLLHNNHFYHLCAHPPTHPPNLHSLPTKRHYFFFLVFLDRISTCSGWKKKKFIPPCQQVETR